MVPKVLEDEKILFHEWAKKKFLLCMMIVFIVYIFCKTPNVISFFKQNDIFLKNGHVHVLR